MSQADELKRENEALRDRLGRLGEACLRVSESLEVNTVLKEVVDNARVLTGSDYGMITVDDGRGRVLDCVTSGITAQERQLLLDFPGWEIYAYLRELSRPLKVSNLFDHLTALGLRADLPAGFGQVATFLAVPMRSRGVQVGNFFLGGKDHGQEFTGEDQEMLEIFASQAATAIVNARRHREEQRAKADLEALIDTAPVGVAVLDARTGDVLSVNRESRRIVGKLCTPGRPLEEMLGGLTVRRAGGQEIPLDASGRKEALGAATTVRAEEIVIQGRDGQSIATLINTTPIRSENGEAESVVVTLQDMRPLQELERMRAEFLGIVSHELRTPLASVKGCTATVLGASSAPDLAEMLLFFRIIDEQANHMRGLICDLLDMGRIEAGTLSVDAEPSTVADLVDQARNAFMSAGGMNPLRIDLMSDLPRVRADGRRIGQVLSNLLSNASRLSPESSPIRVAAVRDGVHVEISVTDEGVGVSPEMLPHLFQKFFQSGDKGRARGHGRAGPGPCDLQGSGGGPRRAHLGRERRTGQGHALHLHSSFGG